MAKKLIEEQNEKAIETFTRMTEKDNLNDFKDAFKEKYQSDWKDVQDKLSSDNDSSGTEQAEEWLEELFTENRKKIDR